MTTNEAGEPEGTPSAAAVEAFRSIEGRWTIRGMENSFTEVCELFPGGHHMVCYATSQNGDSVSRHMSIITWSAEEKCFLYFGIGSSGSVKRYRGAFENGVWSFTGSATIDNAAASVRIVTTPLREGFRFLEEYSLDGLTWITESDLDYVRLPDGE